MQNSKWICNIWWPYEMQLTNLPGTRLTSSIVSTLALFLCNFVLISETKDSWFLFIFSRTSVSWFVSIGWIFQLITAISSSLKLVVGAVSTKRELTDDTGTLMASAIACSKIVFRPAKEFWLVPWIVMLIEMAKGLFETSWRAKNINWKYSFRNLYWKLVIQFMLIEWIFI